MGVDPGSFWVGFAAGVIVGAGMLTGVGWVRIRRRGWTADEELARREEEIRSRKAVMELDARVDSRAFDEVVKIAAKYRHHALRQQLELAKLNRAIRRRNAAIARLREATREPDLRWEDLGEILGPRYIADIPASLAEMRSKECRLAEFNRRLEARAWAMLARHLEVKEQTNGGGSKREGTPANDAAGPRAVGSPKVG